jgi:hypothetical protein
VSDRRDLGFDTAGFENAAALAQQRAHDYEHMDREGTHTDADLAMSMDDDSAAALVAEMANPSGHVDITLAGWAAIFTDETVGMDVGEVVEAVTADDIHGRHVLAGVLTHSLLPDPWTNVDPLVLDGRGDGLEVS